MTAPSATPGVRTEPAAVTRSNPAQLSQVPGFQTALPELTRAS